jgi:cytochrome c-type biogenesis protein CcmH
VRDYLVARYGDFILLRPPFALSTLLLWLTPALALAAGGAAAILRARRYPHVAAERLSAAEEERLARIIDAPK